MSTVAIGDRVKDSPLGAGILTGVTERGMPQIDHVAVAWIEAEDGGIFDPFGVRERHILKRAAAPTQQQERSDADQA
ncbi:MAG: hypothetical protein AAFO57_00225 [Pseudomonadota bacterium]